MAEDKFEPNTGHFHEVMDRASLMVEVWEEQVRKLGAVQSEPRLQAAAAEVAQTLMDFYQLSGRVHSEAGSREVPLKVKRVTVLVNMPGTDEVDLVLDGPSPFPGEDMDFDAHATISVRKGLGVEWCKRVIGVDPEIIDGKRT